MPLQAGLQLGPYEITGALGAGGMGEVYRARDTRLDRVVAVKVLSPALAADESFRQRFTREARTISSLDHPHICTLYDVGEHEGTSFIVMQFLEGRTLRERLAGPLPLPEALEIAMQIASALDSAHRVGIAHRDLKPANIMLTRTGAKLLDFGLAKSVGPAVALGTPDAATTSTNITARGTILGTLQYMAPEQVESREADSRTDIFAMGVVLHEMLTGRKAFEAQTDAGLVAAILDREPPPVSESMAADAPGLSPATRQALDRIVRACLAKDPAARLQSAHDLTLLLRWVADGVADASVPAIALSRPRRRELVAWGLVGAAMIAAVGWGAWTVWRPRADPTTVRISLASSSAIPFSAFGASPDPALSPDGRRLAYETIDANGRSTLALRDLDAVDAHILPGTEGASFPFWSADNRFIAFFAQRKLRKIGVDGGPVQDVCDVASVAGGTWSLDGTILYGGGRRGILRVAAAGGPPTAVTTLDPAQKEAWHEWPFFLSDGRRFLYTAGPPGVVYLGSLESTERVKITESDSKAIYVAPGYLLFMRQGVLLAQPFNASSATLSGEALPVAANVGFDLANTRAAAAFSVSSAGVLAYRTGAAAAPATQLQWFDRAGTALGKIAAPASFVGIDLSPDDAFVAAHRHDREGGDLWVIDLKTGAPSRFTFDATRHYSSPVWSRDGSRIGYATTMAPELFLYQRPSNGAGQDDTLDTTDLGLVPSGWTTDGSAFIYSKANLTTRWDVWAAPVGANRKPYQVTNGPASELLAQVSPDGRWIAYQSDSTGRAEIYVQPFPSLNGKWQVSTNGGTHVRWRKDGREMYFLGPNNAIMAADVLADTAAFRHGSPAKLFVADISDYGVNYPYAVSSDGRRILVETVVKEATTSHMTLTVNWTSVLKKF